MVNATAIKEQLDAANSNLPFWVKPEVRELPHILVDGEVIERAVNGRYSGGFALLVATNQRILIIDKKPIFLAVEYLRYDMVSEVNYTHQLVDSAIHFASFSKDLWFSSFRKEQLKMTCYYIQQKLSEMRHDPKTMQALMNEDMDYQEYLSNQQQPLLPQPHESLLNDEQARELLPTTQQAWDRVGAKLRNFNSYEKSPHLIRRRVAKFNTFQ